MRLALFGDSSESLVLARAAIAAGHELVAVSGVGEHRAEIARLAPQTLVLPNGDALAHGGYAEAVIYAPADVHLPASAKLLRQFVQAGMPVLAVHPPCEPLVAFELDMIRQDTSSPLIPYFDGNGHPALSELAGLVRDENQSPLGRIQQLTFERSIEESRRDAVLMQLARDVALIRAIAGEADRVSGIGPLARDEDFSSLTVHLRSAGGIAVRWFQTAHGQDPDATAKLTLLGSTGTAVLRMPPEPGEWTLSIRGDASERELRYPAFTCAAFAIEGLEQSIRGLPHRPTWNDVCCDLEIIEAVERSLARGRLIDLYHEQHSEASTFKGVMAAGGCLLLFLAMAILFVAAVVEGLRLPFRDHLLWRNWPFYLVVPFLLFLLLQFLWFFVKSPTNTTAATTPPRDV
jgi:hypothetical protein